MRCAWVMRSGAAALALVVGPVAAAPPAPAPGPDIVVQGTRTHPSGWRQAETAHVVLVSDGPESELVRLARNLEQLHRLLAGLLGRSVDEEEALPLRITLIGDVPTFEAMDLRNLRWQQGPFADLFRLTRYYDPRSDGAVMASTRVDQRTVIEHSRANATSVLSYLQGSPIAQNADPAVQASIQGALIGDFATAGMRGPHDLPVTFGEKAIEVPAESLIYAGYAQHYLLTHFPAAYPRWYLDGFAQIFASFAVQPDGGLVFGRSPKGTGAVLEAFGPFPLAKVLDDSYLHMSPAKTDWTPIHAWLLTHFLFFSDKRRPQLNRYLALRASGQSPSEAAKAFGDQAQLARELRAYFGARKDYDVIRFPAGVTEAPLVRRLSEGEAAFVQGRLELGGRIWVPDPPGADTSPAEAAAITRERDERLRARDHWLDRLRRYAAKWPHEAGAQLLLAEAECRTGAADPCLAAATRAQTLAPDDARARTWMGVGLTEQALAAPPGERPARLEAARRAIAAANRLDTEAVEPLLAFYQSFAAAGETPSVTAVDGVQKALAAVPDAPETRLALAQALATLGRTDAVRTVALPLADSPYDSPEKPAAKKLLAATSTSASAGAAQ